jgi:hypothetical protein
MTQLQQLATDAAQVQEDEAAMLGLAQRLTTLLLESGIQAALLGRPVSDTEQREQREMTNTALKAAREKAQQSAWVREKAEHIRNTVPNVVALLEKALPRHQKA